MKLKKFIALAATVAMIGSLTACGSSSGSSSGASSDSSSASADAQNIRIVSACGVGSPYDYGSAEFKKLIEEQSGGRFTVTVYNGDMSSDEIECAEMVQNNNVEIAWISTGALGGFVPDLACFELPFLFENDAHVTAALEGEFGQTLIAEVDEINGLKGLAFHQDGWRNILTNGKVINTVDDMQGVKMRSMQNETCIAMYEALGANPIALSSGEQFSGIQTGVVDGTDNSAIFAVSDGYIEVVNCICDIHHFYSGGIILGSSKWFDSLSEEDQAMVIDCAEKAGEAQRAWFLETDEQYISEYEAKGYTVTRPTDIDAWKAKTASVYDKMYETHPTWKDLVAMVEAAK